MPEKDATSYTWEQKKAALGRQLRPYRKTIVTLSIVQILVSIGNGVVPYITGKFFDTLITPHTIIVPLIGITAAWAALLFGWVLIQVVTNGLSWYADRRNRRFTTDLEANFQANAYTHLLTLPVN